MSSTVINGFPMVLPDNILGMDIAQKGEETEKKNSGVSTAHIM